MSWLTDKLKTRTVFKKSNDSQRTQVSVVNNINSIGSQSSSNKEASRKSVRLQPSARAVDRERRTRERDADNAAMLEYNASAESVRRVRMLIRQKFALDVEVWSHRGIQRAMHKRLMARASRADEILEEIRAIVGGWEQQHFNKPDEWLRASQIKESLLSQQHTSWEQSPPWERRT